MNMPPYILVAEDDPDATFLLQHAFAQVGPGIRTVYTADGRQAIDFLQGKHQSQREQQRHVPALLLLDLKMPRVDGFEVLEWLQRYPALRPQSIVILTSSPAAADVERARQLDADFYVIKPVGLPELLDIARALVTLCESGRWSPSAVKAVERVRPLRGP